MKTILIAVGITALMGVLVHYVDNSGEVILNEKPQISATSTEAVVEEVIPEDWLKEAEEARQAVIDRKRAEAELEDVQSQIEALRVRETELEKELLVY